MDIPYISSLWVFPLLVFLVYAAQCYAGSAGPDLAPITQRLFYIRVSMWPQRFRCCASSPILAVSELPIKGRKIVGLPWLESRGGGGGTAFFAQGTVYVP